MSQPFASVIQGMALCGIWRWVMQRPDGKHLWRCAGCGESKILDHGPEREP